MYPVWSLLSRDISRKTSSSKGDNHTCKVNFTLKTASWDCSSLQNRKESILFSKVYPQAAHIPAAGKEKQRGLSVTWPCVFFSGLVGSVTGRYILRGPPGGGGVEGRAWGKTGKHQSRSVHAQTSVFNHCFDTMETGAVRERNWTTETATGSGNK